MGFKSWRSLSVLLLAGVALAGCNNTPQKEKGVLGASTGNPPLLGGNAQGKTPDPKFPNPNAKVFPQVPNAGAQPNNGLTPGGAGFPTPGGFTPGGFTPSNGGGITPTNPFTPPNGNTLPKGASITPPSPFTPTGGGAPSVAQPNSGFGSFRDTTPSSSLPGVGPSINPPADWK